MIKRILKISNMFLNAQELQENIAFPVDFLTK